MGPARELTRRYAGLIQGKRVQNPFALAYDIYRYRKLSEFLSFAVWEVLHKLRLFPKARYVQLRNGATLTLDAERLDDPDVAMRLDHVMRARGLSISRSEHNWKVLVGNAEGERFGCLYPDDTDLYKSIDDGKTVAFLKRFPQRIKSLFVSSRDAIFVCVEGAVYRSPDGGASFAKVLDLGSSVSFFRHNNGMTETPDGTLIISEYGNSWTGKGWEKLAYLYFSADDGETWQTSDFLIRGGTNKHVHLVKYSSLFDKVFMADGDNYKKLWVTDATSAEDLVDADRWKAVTRLHVQTGGYTSVVETEEKILFGTDYQGGTNFIVESADGETFVKRVMPDPHRRSPIINMVQRRSRRRTEIWAYQPYSTPKTRCLLMCSVDGGETWDKIIEYSGAAHRVWLINTSADMSDVLYFSIEDVRRGDRVVYRIGDR
jgi:hypothetical protein